MLNSIANSYNKVCETWNEFRKRSPVNACIKEFAALLMPDCSILDIGCGTGFPIDDYLAKQGFRVTGIDISDKMLEKANSLRLPRAEFIKSDLFSFRPTLPFGAVIAFDSVWHIPHALQKDIYPKVASLLESGGYFLFTHGMKNGEITGEMFGETFYYSALDADEIVRLLESNGFEILSFIKNYKEPTTGDRDLLVVARKISDR